MLPGKSALEINGVGRLERTLCFTLGKVLDLASYTNGKIGNFGMKSG